MWCEHTSEKAKSSADAKKRILVNLHKECIKELHNQVSILTAQESPHYTGQSTGICTGRSNLTVTGHRKQTCHKATVKMDNPCS